jgi:hypothetical protein
MARHVAPAPGWLETAGVVDIYSVSACISKDFADFTGSWRHNGYWLFDEPATIAEIAADRGASLAGTTLFYYEALETQYDGTKHRWLGYDAERHFPVAPQVPASARLEGFDVVSFSQQTAAECSPLSCNGLGVSLPVNAHCLLGDLDTAVALLEASEFNRSEPGPFRIFSVHTM